MTHVFSTEDQTENKQKKNLKQEVKLAPAQARQSTIMKTVSADVCRSYTSH